MAKKLYLTDLGKGMVVASLGGQSIAFTNFAAGEGVIADPTRDNLKSRTSLVTPVSGLSNITITSGIEKNAYIKLTGSFSSDDNFNLPDSRTSFRWTELGVFACGQGDETFNADGTTTTFTLVNTTIMIYHIDFTESGTTTTVPKSDYTFDATTNSVTFTTAPASGIVITVYYPDVSSKQLFAYGYETNPNTVSETAVGAVPNAYSIETSFSISNDNTEVTIKFDATSSNAPYAVFQAHLADYNNPHRVNANQIGLESTNVDNLTARFDTSADTLQALESGDTLSVLFHKIYTAIAYVMDRISGDKHVRNYDNPHQTSISSVSGNISISNGGTGSNGVDGTFTTFWKYLTHKNKPQNNAYGQIKVSAYVGHNYSPYVPEEEGEDPYYIPHSIKTGMKSDVKAVIVMPCNGITNPLINSSNADPVTFGGLALAGFKCHSKVGANTGYDVWDDYSAIRINNSAVIDGSPERTIEVGTNANSVSTDYDLLRYYYIAISADGVYDFGTGTNNPTFIP